VGLKYLKKATKRAVRDDRSTITIEDVDAIHDDARDGIRRDHIDTLGTHKRLLYDIVSDAGSIPAGQLHETYKQRCADPKARRHGGGIWRRSSKSTISWRPAGVAAESSTRSPSGDQRDNRGLTAGGSRTSRCWGSFLLIGERRHWARSRARRRFRRPAPTLCLRVFIGVFELAGKSSQSGHDEAIVLRCGVHPIQIGFVLVFEPVDPAMFHGINVN